MDQIRYRIEDVREAEQARMDFAAAGAVGGADQPPQDPPLLVIRQQLWIVRRDARLRATALRDRLRRRRGAPRPPRPRTGRPAASVLITVYNDGTVLQRAIESVKAQTMPDWELIIWDDGSTDPETLAVVEQAAGYRISTYRGRHQGAAAARIAAAGAARGDVLVTLNPRDALGRTYLEKALITFARYPAADIVLPTMRINQDPAPPTYQYPAPVTHQPTNQPPPVSSAVRRRVWDRVRGVPGAGEEGAFWRAVAAAGFRAWPLYEALVHSARPEGPGTEGTVIGAPNDPPTLPDPALFGDPKQDLAALHRELRQRVFHMPSGQRETLVVFMAWMTRGGGAESFLLSALGGLREEFDVVVITTNPVSEGQISAANEFLEVTPYVYDLASLVGPEALSEMVSSILYRVRRPRVLLVGSLWAFDHLRDLKLMSRGWGRIIDLEFNHTVHIGQLLKAMPVVDEVLVAHRRLQSLLRDYYRVDKPVGVLYIAPPEHDLARYEGLRAGRAGGRLRIGWLGRNSPEKRPDLVAAIAAALPEADFLIAGSGMRTLPPQPENVSVVGWVDDALEFLAGLDFVLNTSDIEGVSVTAMEGLRLGVPVLTRDVGGMAELVRDGVNGLVYDAGQVLGLADRLRDEGLVERVRAGAGSERLPAGFHFDTMLDTLRTALLGPIPMYPDSSAID